MTGLDRVGHKAAMKQKAGQITAGGQTTNVNFEAVEGEVNDRIDDCAPS
jgi:hypothetical protein